MSKKHGFKPKVGDTVKIKDIGIDGYLMGIPFIEIDENNRRCINDINSVITKVKHGRGKSKGITTLTLLPA